MDKEKDGNKGHLGPLFSELEEEEEQHRTILRDLVLPPHMLARRDDEGDGESDEEDDEDDLRHDGSGGREDSDERGKGGLSHVGSSGSGRHVPQPTLPPPQPQQTLSQSQYNYYDNMYLPEVDLDVAEDKVVHSSSSSNALQHTNPNPNPNNTLTNTINNTNTSANSANNTISGGGGSHNDNRINWTIEMTDALIEHYAKHLNKIQQQSTTANAVQSLELSVAHYTWRVIAKDLSMQFFHQSDVLTSKCCKNKFIKLKHEYAIVKMIEREKHSIALQLYNNNNGEVDVLTSSLWESRKKELINADNKLKRFFEPSYRFMHTEIITNLLPNTFAETNSTSILGGVGKKGSEGDVGEGESGFVSMRLQPPVIQDDNVRRRFGRQHSKIAKEVRTIVEDLQESMKHSLGELQRLLGEENLLLQTVSTGLVQQPWTLFHQRAVMPQQQQQSGGNNTGLAPSSSSSSTGQGYLTMADMNLVSSQQTQHIQHHNQQQQQQVQQQQSTSLLPLVDPSINIRNRALFEIRSNPNFAPLLASYEDCELIFSKILIDDNSAFTFLVVPEEHKVNYLVTRLHEVKHLQRSVNTAVMESNSLPVNKRQRK